MSVYPTCAICGAPAKRLNWTVKRMPKPGPTFIL